MAQRQLHNSFKVSQQHNKKFATADCLAINWNFLQYPISVNDPVKQSPGNTDDMDLAYQYSCSFALYYIMALFLVKKQSQKECSVFGIKIKKISIKYHIFTVNTEDEDTLAAENPCNCILKTNNLQGFSAAQGPLLKHYV